MLLAEYRISERRACATVFLHRSVYRYVDQPRDDRAVRQRMKEIAETRVRYGFNRIHILLRREGWRDNHNELTAFTRKKG
jgi:putative transposase